eukprot:10368272-Prorocentrum_lima.AAC.1
MGLGTATFSQIAQLAHSSGRASKRRAPLPRLMGTIVVEDSDDEPLQRTAAAVRHSAAPADPMSA